MSRIAVGVLAVALFATNAHADTIIAGGNLPGAANTWTVAGSPYILQGDVTVPAGATLTIDPGVEVRATANSDGQGAGLNATRIELTIHGALDVNGTANSPVVFKSSSTTSGTWYGLVLSATATSVSLENTRIEDAIQGITSNVAGSVITTSNVTIDSASSYGILLNTGTSTFDRVSVVSSGSYGIYVTGSASPTFTNCIVRNSVSYGVYIQHTTSGQSASFDNCTLNANGTYNFLTNANTANSSSVTITDSIITNASYGVYRGDSATISVMYSNVWANSTNYSGATGGTGTISANPLYVSASDMRLTSNSPSRFGAGNGGDQGAQPYDTVATPGLYGTLWSNTTLTAAGSPYTLAGDLTVAPGVTLTIEPGATLQFQANSDIMMSGNNAANGANNRGELIVRGRLVADATPQAPITITSTTTTSGSWFGIDLDASAANSVLDNVTIARANTAITYRSMGANTITNTTAESASSYGLLLRTGSPTIAGFRAINSGSYGIYITDSSSPTLVNCIVRNSVSYGVYVQHTTSGQSVTLDNCTLNANGTYNFLSNANTANSASITIADSIITNASYGVYRGDSATINVTNTNVWANSTNYSGATGGSGTISANPLYVSTSDMRLTSNSPSRFGAGNGGDQGAQPYDTVATPGLYGTLWSNTTLTAAGSPYTLAGDLTVAPGVTLTIEAGATLQFQANSDIMMSGNNAANGANNRGELIVRGRLVADGTTQAPIVFTSTTTTSGSWFGIDLDTSAVNSLLDHVTIARANTALTYRATGSGNVISFVSAESASSYGLLLRAGTPTINGWSSISSGSYGVYITDSSSPTLTNCVVRNSVSYGVYVQHTTSGRTASLMNCTLNANGTYNFLSNANTANSAAITITNSIITNASYGVYRGDSATVNVTYSDVWGNSTNYSGATAGTGCISANPQYVSATDLHLQGTSVAIDAGTTGAANDADGIARPLDGNGLAGAQYDMGAYELVLTAQCGNGAVEPGEFCDSGTNNGTYGYCNANCTALGPRCGDSVMNGNEQCDDGNASNTDACLNSCMNASCGDGHLRAGSEQCDDGNQFNTDACTTTCNNATCGDGHVRAGVETCDDGNQSNTDACLTTCAAPSCGDGYVRTGVEDCDDQNSVNTDACLNTCAAAKCGDGFVRPGFEACDDGNMIATDACTATCAAATCGDSVVHAGVEECDDANQSNTDTCVTGCTAAKCGDGYVRSGVEVCDDGNLNNDDGCSAMCVSTTCGDGILQADNEECDDGNMVDTDACRYNCADASCGDGVVRDGVEACDDGNVMADDGCSPACKIEGDDMEPPGMPDAGGGCCQTSGGIGGSWLLALGVLLAIHRRRRGFTSLST